MFKEMVGLVRLGLAPVALLRIVSKSGLQRGKKKSFVENWEWFSAGLCSWVEIGHERKPNIATEPISDKLETGNRT